MSTGLRPEPAVVRPAEPADVDPLVRLEQACFDDAWSPVLVAGELAGPGAVVRLATDATGHLQGWASVSIAGDVADLRRIAVAPAARTRGLASLLLDSVIERAREAGAVRMLLEVADDNVAARALYERFDFATIHRRRGYYAGGGDALVMERALAPVVP